MVINNYEIQRTELLKSFGVLLDEKLIRKENIKYKDNELAKNWECFYKPKH